MATTLLSACNLPTAGGSWCAPDDLVAPEVVSPTNLDTVESLTPTLTWSFAPDCRPDAYRIRLYSPGPDYPVDELTGEADGSATAWVPTGSLQPGTPYIWQVAAVSGDVAGPFSSEPPGALTTGVFWTEPICARADEDPWPPPVLLKPVDGEVVTTTTTVGPTTAPYVSFTWDDPLGCFPDVGYLVEVSQFEDFHELEVDPDSPSLFRARGTFLPWVMPLGWVWQECSPYYWRVKVNLPAAPYSEAESFRINTTGSGCAEMLPLVTLPPLLELLTPVPSPTAPPTSLPKEATARALQDGACLLGPDFRFETVDYLMMGESSPIVGRHPVGMWWVIRRPDQGGDCWILADKVEALGDLTRVPVRQPPPLPTATPPPPTETPAKYY
jgi:hypothetical protein